MKAARSADVMRPGERALAESAAAAAPKGAAPAVPEPAMQPVKVGPVASAPAVPPVPGQGVQAPRLNPSQPPADVPAPAAAAAAQPPVGQAPSPVAAAAAESTPPSAAPAASPAPTAPLPPKSPPAIPPANALPPGPKPAVQQDAERFVRANLGDFGGRVDMSHMPNTDTMAVPDQLKASVLQIADDNEDLIQKARGGVVSDASITQMANDLAVDRDTLQQTITREFGDPVKRPAIALAARTVEMGDLGKLYELADKVASGSASSDEIAEYERSKQVFTQYRAQLAGVAAESGRLQRVFGFPVGLPDAVKDHVAQIISANNPNMQEEARMIRLAGTPSGIATIVNGSAWARSKGLAFSLLHRIFINGILSGTTAVKILWNNTVNLGLNALDIGAAAAYRGTANLAARLGGYPTPEQGAELEDFYANMHGLISGFADGLRVAGRVLKAGKGLDQVERATESTARDKPQKINEFFPGLNGTMYGSAAHVIDRAIDLPGTVVSSVDDFTKTMGYRGYLHMMTMKEIRSRLAAGTLKPGDAEAVARQMMEHPTEEMEAAAEAWAHRMTFQTPWLKGGPGDTFQKWLSQVPVARFIFPFMRTATNIFKQSVERTPFAFFSARMRAQLAAGGLEGDMARARIATGTMMTGMLAWMAIHDDITGDAPKDPKERAIWEADGHQPYSVRIYDPFTGKSTWRSYMWFEPMATIAAITSDAVAAMRYIHGDAEADTMMPHSKMAEDAAEHIVASVITNTANKTFMQGAAMFSEMYNDPQRAFGMWADQMGANMVPYSGFTKMLRNLQDPYLRQAYTLIDKIRDEVPTIMGVKGSKTLPSRLDIFGQPRVREGGNSIFGPLTPMPGSPAKHDPVTNELRDLMEQTRTVPITMPSKRLALLGSGSGLQDGEGMELTPSEYHDYVEDSRSQPVFDNGTLNLHDKLEQVMRSPVYMESTPAERVELIKFYQHQADKAGAALLWQDRQDFRERMTAWTAEMARIKFNQ